MIAAALSILLGGSAFGGTMQCTPPCQFTMQEQGERGGEGKPSPPSTQPTQPAQPAEPTQPAQPTQPTQPTAPDPASGGGNGAPAARRDLAAPPVARGVHAGTNRSGGSYGLGVLERERGPSGTQPGGPFGAAASATPAVRRASGSALPTLSDGMKMGRVDAMLDQKTPAQLKSAELTRVAKSQLAVGDFGGALRSLDLAVTLDTGNAEAWFKRAEAFNQAQDYAQAVAAAEQALKLEPENADGWSEKAWALYKQRQYKEAIEAATRAIQLAPDRPEGYAIRARARYALGDREGAIADARIAASLDPRLKGLLAAMLAGDYSEDSPRMGDDEAARMAPAPAEPKLLLNAGLALLTFLLAALAWVALRRKERKTRTFSSLARKRDPESTPQR